MHTGKIESLQLLLLSGAIRDFSTVLKGGCRKASFVVFCFMIKDYLNEVKRKNEKLHGPHSLFEGVYFSSPLGRR